MTAPLTVVVIRSLSYTGTTWINCLLGCHDRAFALGPPDRVINLYGDGWDDACRVHGPQCSFWPEFHKQYDPSGNFYLQLASFAGKDYIVINNPLPDGKAAKDLYHPDILLKHIRVVRDGRAVCRSFTRNHAGKDFVYAVKEWFLPSARDFEFDRQDPDVLCLRYEDVARDQFTAIKRCGDFLRLAYSENFYKFWEFDHHVAAGNASVYGMIRRFQQDKKFSGNKKDFYEKEFERLQREPEKPVFDKGWKAALSRRELFLFDFCCGAINERWGYERDTFSAGEFEQFQNELRKESICPSDMPEPQPLASASRLRKIINELRLNPLVTKRRLFWVLVALLASYCLVIALTALIVW